MELRNWNAENVAIIDEFWHTEGQLKGYEANAELILKKIGENQSILEVGCGSGMNYQYLKGKVKEYICGDVSPKFLDVLRKRFPELNPIDLDIHNLPFKDNEYENVINMNVLQHLPYYKEPIKELVRIASKKVLIVTWCNTYEDILKVDGDFHSNFYRVNHMWDYCMTLPQVKKVDYGKSVGQRYWILIEK